MSKKDKPDSEQSAKNKWQEIAEQDDEIEEPMLKEDDTIDLEGINFPSHQELEQQLTAMEQKADEYKNQAVRAHAEMENVRKRSEREISNARKFGAESLINDLLPVVDSLVRGLEGPEAQDPHVKNMRKGIALTLDLLNKTLAKNGVEIIDPAPGDAFNPELHEAMSTQEVPKAKPNTIVQVVQKGYQLNGRILRAAMVIVAA